MKKVLALVSISCLAALVSACSVTTTSSSIKKVGEAPLASGATTKIGYKPPQTSWQCIQIDRYSETWNVSQFKAMVDWRGPYDVLQKHAIAYANKHNLKPNYIYLNAPRQTQISGFYLHPTAQASAIYYKCKNPPALYNKVF